MSSALAASDSKVKPKDESSEVLNSWKSRWNDNAIGWHIPDVHESLLKHGHQIIPQFTSKEETCSNPVRVFVPLCGKTVDMAFLARHKSVSEVVGIDGIKKALEEFSSENPDLGLAEKESSDAYERLVGKNILLLKGDFFELNEASVGGLFDSVWDRASIVAIDPSLREDYVRVTKGLVKPGGTLLVSTFERRTGTEQGIKGGPPFSVPESEVRRLYESQDWVESVELLEEINQYEKSPASKKFESQGVTSLFELVFVIKVKA
uniref:thiopurine S-methyltransferase n=2 Tax=Cyclophora tenuis TaxID=216820 RepID=A0A7S1D8X3_CYCTE|mmetsp:Transcript_4377/g.7579  ORF Transcript_4377/g.7579 Transcript_4377/m.7579 type:complete len:263 (+) Transcript_4377:179-967(+)